MPDFQLRAIHLDAGFPHQRDFPRCCISVPGGFTRLPVKAKLREKRSGCLSLAYLTGAEGREERRLHK